MLAHFMVTNVGLNLTTYVTLPRRMRLKSSDMVDSVVVATSPNGARTLDRADSLVAATSPNCVKTSDMADSLVTATSPNWAQPSDMAASPVANPQLGESQRNGRTSGSRHLAEWGENLNTPHVMRKKFKN